MIETIPSGTVLHGRYRIERVLGSGGFGHVYLAVNIETNQQCAVKEYLVTGTSGQEQLQHEARVLSQLHHPNIPAFLDAFMSQGRYFVVLNYIEGHDLTDLLRMARQRNTFIPIAQIMQWMLAICDAVMFLHSQHPIVIHRDIKPDNIRITPNGTAVLVDLGNAKAVADGARTLFFIRHQGTPGYAPPEQYPGGTGTDARSDVYALGGTLYFALTGQEPPSVSTRNQYVQQHRPDLPSLQERLAENPPENNPEANALRQFRLGVTKPGKPAPRHSYHLAQLGTLPPELLNQLNLVIQRAMALKPKDRYQYVADFANELRRILNALPTPPQSPTSSSNPYSTQPDLPQLYEALQAAKENARQESDSSASQQASDPITCPRCGNTLDSKAAFCPRCGASLNKMQPENVAKAQPQNPDIASEQTLQVNPMRANKKAPGLPSQRTGQGTRPAIPSLSDKQPMAQAQSHSATATAARTSPPMQQNNDGSSNGTRQKRASGNSKANLSLSSFNMKVVIALVVIIVLLIVVVLVLSITLSTTGHHHPPAPSQQGLIFYYQRFSPYIAC
jgi:serine/threonine protein kinase